MIDKQVLLTKIRKQIATAAHMIDICNERVDIAYWEGYMSAMKMVRRVIQLYEDNCN